MNIEIGAEATLFPEKEYISGIFCCSVGGVRVNIGSLNRDAGSGPMEQPGITPIGRRVNLRTGFWRTAWGAGTSGMMSPVLNPTMPLYAKHNVTYITI
jgi:hypothetical protein